MWRLHWAAFGPYAPTVPSHDAADGRQPNAAARKLRRGVQPLEDAVELRDVLHVEPGAIVFHKVHRLIVAALRAYLDLAASVALVNLTALSSRFSHIRCTMDASACAPGSSPISNRIFRPVVLVSRSAITVRTC